MGAAIGLQKDLSAETLRALARRAIAMFFMAPLVMFRRFRNAEGGRAIP